ncbi:MAG: cytochrome c2 [Polaribacter sp.]|jgi:cytochrome c2
MFVSDNININIRNKGKIQTTATVVSAVFLALLLLSPVSKAVEKQSLGQPASAAEIKGWDIDIRPDGKGLPTGRGDAVVGEGMFIKKCASCHGEFGEGAGRYPVLAGGVGSLDTYEPVKTVGSYWPYATTVFDYIRRAMPFGHAQSLSNDEVYAMTAYILYSNDVIEEDFELNRNTLALVEMPNRNGFIEDGRPDAPTTAPCMTNCLSKKPVVTGRARQVNVTPDEEVASVTSSNSDSTDVDAARGKTVFTQCIACHSVDKGENRFGPSLHAIFGRKVGGLETFTNYSAALSSSDITWSQESLAKFLNSPQQFLPGTSMPFGGVNDEGALNDLLEYLRIETANGN